MKHKHRFTHYCGIATSALFAISSASAATLTWDAGGAGGAITNGGGAWLIAGLWNDGGVAATWTSGDDAIFGGVNTAGGAVTLASPTTVGTLTFNQFLTSYTLGTTGQALTINSGITVNSSAAAVNISSPIILGGAQNWTNNSLTNFSNSTGSLNLNSTLNLNGNALTIGGSGTTYTPAVISGAGGISVTSGRLWLGGAAGPVHTYSGDTSITGGAVVMISANASANSNININGGVLESYWTTNFTQALGSGAGQVRLIGGASGWGNNNGGNAVVLGNNAANEAVWGVANEAGNASSTGFFNPSTLVLNTQYTQNTGITFQNRIDLNGTTRTIQAGAGTGGGATSTISGIIRNTRTSAAGLSKTGPGLLVLSGANTYDGGTTISAGTLAFSGTATMPSTGAVAVSSGATLGVNLGGAGNWTNGTSGVGTLGGLLGGLGGAGSSTVNYTGDVGLRLSLSANTTYAGNIANVGTTLGLTKAGGSTLTLTGTGNSYSGATRIDVGQLTLNGALTGGTAISTSGTATFFQSGTGVISGASSFTLNSTGTSTFFGTNSYSGSTTLAAAGVIAVGNNSALGSGTLALNAGTIQSNDATARSLSNPVTIGGNFTVGGTGNMTFSNTGASALGGNRTITVTTSGVNATFAQAFSGGNSITKAGAGTLTLSGTSTYSAGTTLTLGTLVAAGSSALGSGAITWGVSGTTLQFQNDANLTVANTLTTSVRNATRTLVVDRATAGAATNLSFNSAPNLDTGTVFNFGKGSNVSSGTPTITFSNGIGNSDSNNATLTTTPTTITPTGVNLVINGITSSARTRGYIFQGDSTGNIVSGTFANGSGTSVRKAGTGTWTFSGTNSYTGVTEITGGTLRINGTTHSSSAFTVSSGATLAGAGTVAGTVAVSGNVAPGNGTVAIGTLNAGATTWNGGANLFQFDLAASGTTSDRLAVTGALTKGTGSTFQFDFMSSTPVFGTTFTLATFGSHTGGFAVENFSHTGLTGPNYSSSYFTLNATSLQFTAVPEASNLIIGGLLGLGMMSRRRKNA